MSEGDTEQWVVSIFGCLSQETASALYLAANVAQLPPLPQEAEACLQGLLVDVDITALVASNVAAAQFGFEMLTCLPGRYGGRLAGRGCPRNSYGTPTSG